MLTDHNQTTTSTQTTPLPPFSGCHTRDYLLLSNSASVNYTILIVLYCFLAAVSVPLNTLVIVAMVRLKRYRMASDALIIMLCITDIGSGILTCPAYVYIYISLLTVRTYPCFAASFLKMVGYAFSLASIITIGLLTVEMYLSIVKPFKRARQPKTYLKLFFASCATIMLVTIVAIYIIPLEAWNLFQSTAGCIFSAVFLVLAFTQYKREGENQNCLLYTSPSPRDS